MHLLRGGREVVMASGFCVGEKIDVLPLSLAMLSIAKQSKNLPQGSSIGPVRNPALLELEEGSLQEAAIA
jgi:hypothetical protein